MYILLNLSGRYIEYVLFYYKGGDSKKIDQNKILH